VSEAFFWGILAASSLLIGGLLVMWRPVRQSRLGLIMAFGAGVLLSAVAYELVAEAFDTGGEYWPIALGLAAGALTFYVGDWYIDRMGGEGRKSSDQTAGGGSALPLTLGIVLDGIPESITLGLTLLGGEGVSAAMLAAVFLSNLPESMAATTGFQKSGRSRRWIIGLWLAVIAVSGLASLAGYGLLDTAEDTTVAFVLAFAAGAVLTMLADTMMPEAFKYGGSAVGLLTTAGFAVAVAIVALENA
jgi:zinc transporter, ZIP family